MVGILKNALSWLLFMPNFFPPLPVGRIETFPWATFFSVDRRLTLPAAYTFVMALFLLSAGYSLYTYGNPISVLRSYLSLINASLIFYRIWNTDGADFLRIVKALISVLCLHLVLSLWQFSGTVPDAIMGFVQYFTPRATGEALGQGRGVSGIYAEPAYAAYAVHYSFVFLLLLAKIHPFSFRGLALIAVLLAFDLIVTRSATDVVMLGVLLTGFLNRRNIFRTSLFVAALLMTALLYARLSDDPPRSVMLLYNLFFNLNLNDPYLTVFNESGFRLISIFGGYIYGLIHPLGGGIGSWPVTSLVALELTGIEAFEIYYYLELNDGFFYPTRPSAFASELFLEAGWVGFLLYVFAFFGFARFRELIRNPWGRAVFFMFLFNFFALGTIGDPIGTAVLGLTYVYILKFKEKLPSGDEEEDFDAADEGDPDGGSDGGSAGVLAQGSDSPSGAPTPLSPSSSPEAPASPTPGAADGFNTEGGSPEGDSTYPSGAPTPLSPSSSTEAPASPTPGAAVGAKVKGGAGGAADSSPIASNDATQPTFDPS